MDFLMESCTIWLAFINNINCNLKTFNIDLFQTSWCLCDLVQDDRTGASTISSNMQLGLLTQSPNFTFALIDKLMLVQLVQRESFQNSNYIFWNSVSNFPLVQLVRIFDVHFEFRAPSLSAVGAALIFSAKVSIWHPFNPPKCQLPSKAL